MTEYTRRSTKIFKYIFRLSVFALILSIFSQMIISNMLAVKSTELFEFQEKKAQLEKDIIGLEFELSRLSTLSYIETQATAQGFVKMTDSVIAVKDPTTASAVSLR